MILKDRKAGVLMPIFSLPSPYGIGTFGKDAYAFADCLKKAGQSYWQILPIGPTGYGDSPYQSFSTYAGNPYFIDLDMLKEEGLLTDEEICSFEWGENPESVDYGLMYQNRCEVLAMAWLRFKPDANYVRFITKESRWLDTYVNFMSRKEGWSEEFYRFVQYKFFTQWLKLKNYVNSLGISIIGDIPIYVAMDSADVFADKNLFQFNKDGSPSAVAGCPPDAFSDDGQLWGNPLYDWSYHKKTGYKWWIDRMKHCFRLYDVTRVDHFRGFDEYYTIPYGSENAKIGEWKKGPGLKLFKALHNAIGDKPIIAEDLGFLTPSVEKLVQDCGFPGMKVLEFCFDSRDDEKILPDKWKSNNVAYTGTHDNQTVKSWFMELTDDDRQCAADYMKRNINDIISGDYVYDFIRMTMGSCANTAIIPLHDYKRLTKGARINTPATCGGNWQYRFTRNIFCDKVWDDILTVTKVSERA